MDLDLQPALSHPELLAKPVVAALAEWPGEGRDEIEVAAIDPDLADTAAFCEYYGVPPEESANCVVIAARRGGETSYAACLVTAVTRADVNGVVRRRLGARKASFAPVDDTLAATGMEYGGITPVGLPPAGQCSSTPPSYSSRTSSSVPVSGAPSSGCPGRWSPPCRARRLSRASPRLPPDPFAA